MKLVKKINYIGFILAGMITFNACDSYIEEEVFSDIASENFIDQDNADQLIVGIYNSLRLVYSDYTYKFLGTDIF